MLLLSPQWEYYDFVYEYNINQCMKYSVFLEISHMSQLPYHKKDYIHEL